MPQRSEITLPQQSQKINKQTEDLIQNTDKSIMELLGYICMCAIQFFPSTVKIC